MHKNQQYDISLDTYNEAKALQQLLESADELVATAASDYEAGNLAAWDRQFTITVNGVQTAFLLGGPQIQALCAFVQSIADENGYTVDLNSSSVTE